MSLDVGYLPTAFVDTVTKNFFNFNGRTSRMGFWHFFLAYIVIAIIVGVVTGMLGGIGQKLSMLFSLIMFLPAYGIGARRLHDINKSGWWQLLVLTVIGILVLIYWWAQPGDNNANTHGGVPAAKAV